MKTDFLFITSYFDLHTLMCISVGQYSAELSFTPGPEYYYVTDDVHVASYLRAMLLGKPYPKKSTLTGVL